MKVKNRILSYLTIALAVVSVAACNYKEKDEMDGKGVRRIRMQVAEGTYGFNQGIVALDPVKSTSVFVTINRDAISAADLQTETSVTFELLDSATLHGYNQKILQYNIDTDTTFVPGDDPVDSLVLLPTEFFSISGTDFDVASGKLTFHPGESVKDIMVTVDPTLPDFDFTASYGLVAHIKDSPAPYTTSAGFNTVVMQLITKNVFDGIYTVTAKNFNDNVLGSTATANTPNTMYLVTNGQFTSNVYDPSVPGYFHSFINNGGGSYYGNFGIQFAFDASGKVLSATNLYTDAAPRSRTASLDPSGENQYDFDTKTLKVKYWLNQGNPPIGRTLFDETWVFKSAR